MKNTKILSLEKIKGLGAKVEMGRFVLGKRRRDTRGPRTRVRCLSTVAGS